MAAIFGMLSVPIAILNFFGGIIGGIWLAVLGRWNLIGLGFAATFVSTFGASIALAPGIIFAVPGAKALDSGKLFLAVSCMGLATLWTYAVMTVWCLGSFHTVFGYYRGGSLWPYLLWAYSMAAGPWTYMATREARDSHGEYSPATVTAFAACVGLIAVMGVILSTGEILLSSLLLAFCPPLAVAFAFQLWLLIAISRERTVIRS